MITVHAPGTRRQSWRGPVPPSPRLAASLRRGLSSPGQRVDPLTLERLGTAFRGDFTAVRVHTDPEAARSAREMGAQAYTAGRHIVFAEGRYAPGTSAGDHLLAHELAHVAQQQDAPDPHASALSVGDADDLAEQEAEHTAFTAARADGTRSADLRPRGPRTRVRRRVEMRDVGRGEQSGFARLPEFIERLNAMSTGLTYALAGANLTYTVKAGGTLSEFDRMMMRFIDLPAVLPLRLTSRSGLLGSPATGFHDQVISDAFTSGYLDIDDILASTDLGLQVALAHILTERSATRDYARRLGTPGLDAAFAGPHARGITAEEQVLRDFFGDPTIRALPEPVHPAIGAGSHITARNYRNSRRDIIQWRILRGSGKSAGVDPNSIRVLTRDGRTLTAEEYRDLLLAERIRTQIERERLGGATEYSEGGRRIPAP